MLACGIILTLIGGYVQKEEAPYEPTYGAIVDGEYVYHGTTVMNDHPEAYESAGQLKGVGIGVAILGLLAVVASAVMKENEYGNQN